MFSPWPCADDHSRIEQGFCSLCGAYVEHGIANHRKRLVGEVIVEFPLAGVLSGWHEVGTHLHTFATSSGEFVLDNDSLSLGGVSYGNVAAGDHVLIKDSKVFVNMLERRPS